jgi:quinoprotein glucose dehydrogenase
LPAVRTPLADCPEPELWTVELPASAQSTPMTYEWNGKQFIVICAGGHGKMKSKMGDSVVAFALE